MRPMYLSFLTVITVVDRAPANIPQKMQICPNGLFRESSATFWVDSGSA